MAEGGHGVGLNLGRGEVARFHLGRGEVAVVDAVGPGRRGRGRHGGGRLGVVRVVEVVGVGRLGFQLDDVLGWRLAGRLLLLMLLAAGLVFCQS